MILGVRLMFNRRAICKCEESHQSIPSSLYIACRTDVKNLYNQELFRNVPRDTEEHTFNQLSEDLGDPDCELIAT
jgi:hypothetical protein